MARDFVLPDLGEGLTEAEIRQVLVREGDVVGEDAPLLKSRRTGHRRDSSPFGGRVDKIHVHPGQTVKVGQVLVSFGEGRLRPAASRPPTRSIPPARSRPSRRPWSPKRTRPAGAGDSRPNVPGPT